MTSMPDTERIIAAVGGGGLLHGLSQAELKFVKPVEIIGVEPQNAATYYQSFKAAKAISLYSVSTIAKSLAVRNAYPDYFHHFEKNKRAFYTISEEDIFNAEKYMRQKEKIKLEYASTLASAAFLQGKISLDKKTVIILCAQAQHEKKERNNKYAI
jgi:threonine dehydratase